MNGSVLVQFRAKDLFRLAFAFCLVFFLAKPALSQNTNTGEIRGTVTDSSGAVVPGVTVTLTNIDTGVTADFKTNEAGIYDTVSTPPGNYNISFSKEGFKKFVRGPVVLRVAVITEDAALQVGALTQEVTVVGGGAPLLQTETGQQTSILDSKTIQELPQAGAGITGNDWANFTAFLPGAASTPHGRVSEGAGAWNSGDAVMVNGNLPNYANFLQDGATTQLPVSNNNDNEVFETISEVQILTSSYSAQYGLGGAVFNQISKSGTNAFHGSAYEYLQNAALNAGAYFGNQQHLPVTPLRYSEWGGSIGGPIRKDKLFVYFDRDKIHQFSAGSGAQFTTMPTAAMKAGDFAGLPPIFDPTSTTGSTATGTFSRTQFANNQIPAGDVDSIAAKLLSYWPSPNTQGTCSSTFPNLCVNNYAYVATAPNPNLRYFGRIDYNLAEKNRISWSISQKNNNGINVNQLPCPLNCYSGDIDGYNTQVTDTWSISPTMVNELRMGYTRQGNWFVPYTNGFDPQTQLGLQDPKFNQFPNINMGGSNAVTSLNPGTYAIYIENLYDPSDVLTLIRGKHILKFGLEVLISEGNTTPWGAHDAGSFSFTGNYTAGPNATGTGLLGEGALTGSAFADFLLGDVQSWSANNQGMTGMRMKSPQAFIQDDWKVKPNLTVNLGLRYTGTTGMSEEHNRMGAFDPDVVNVVGPYAGTMGAMWFAGQDNRDTLQKPVWDIFMPRAGFAWLVKPNTTVRGGFGLFSYNFSMDDYGNGMGFGSNSKGNASDLSGGLGSAPLVHLDANAATMAAVLPYVAASTNPKSYIMSPSPYSPGGYQPYEVPPAKIYEWSLAVERQFAEDFMASIAYVGSHGFNLQFPTDLNQITNPALLAANDVAGCDGTGTNPLPCNRPYPAFGGIGGNNYNAISNYHSLQLMVVKRFANGLTFNANYVWSHMLDDQDSAGWGSTGGDQNWQIGNNPTANYSNSNFDIRHAVHAIASYELPFGLGKTFLSKGTALDALVGGWRLSGTFVAQTGNPFTMWDSSSVNSYSQAGTWYPNVVPGQKARLSNRALADWFNTAAFVAASPGTFGNSARTSVYGPGLTNLNLSLGKTFHWRERIALQLRGDFINALNHPSFSFPNSDVTSASEGVITSVTNAARTAQISARLMF